MFFVFVQYNYLLYMCGFSITFVYFVSNLYFRRNLYINLNMYLSVCFVEFVCMLCDYDYSSSYCHFD
jgi:hypothetical protein